MSEYTNNIDIEFFKELNSDISYGNLDDCCLISKDKLENDCIILKCGHKFNQIPLYLDYLEQKKSARKTMEVIKMANTTFKCPYCRIINNSDVFSHEVKNSQGIKLDTMKCSEILKYGKNKGKQCSCNIFLDKLCKRHYNLKLKKNI